MEGNGAVTIKAFLVFEDGDVSAKDIKLPSTPILLEGIRREDEEDKGEVFEAC